MSVVLAPGEDLLKAETPEKNSKMYDFHFNFWETLRPKVTRPRTFKILTWPLTQSGCQFQQNIIIRTGYIIFITILKFIVGRGSS